MDRKSLIAYGVVGMFSAVELRHPGHAPHIDTGGPRTPELPWAQLVLAAPTTAGYFVWPDRARL